jgi:hypothetical protein
MRKILFALLALTAACADNSTPNDDDNAGGGGGGGGGGGDDGDGDGDGDGSGSDTTTADRLQDYNDVATALGQNLAIGEAVLFSDAINFAYGRTPNGFIASPGPDYVVYDGQRAGLTIRYKVFCRDTADLFHPCDGFEDHAHVNPTYSGSITGAAATMSNVQRKAAWIVRDTTLPSIRLGGDGTDSFAATFATGQYTLSVTDNLNRLLYAPGATVPNAGKLELAVHATRNRPDSNPADRTFDVNALVEFSGAETATLTLDTTEIFSLSLTSGAVTRI